MRAQLLPRARSLLLRSEPDYPTEQIQGIVLRRVTSTGNSGCGFSVNLGQLSSTPHEVGIAFEDCHTSHNGQNGYLIDGIHSQNLTGQITINGGSVEHMVGPAVVFFDKSADSVPIRIEGLSVANVSSRGPVLPPYGPEGYWLNSPFVFQSYPCVSGGDSGCDTPHPWEDHPFPFGGVEFRGVTLEYSRNLSSAAQAWPWLRSYHIDRRGKSSPGEKDIVGNVAIRSSTPEAVCAASIAPGPQLDVAVTVDCNGAAPKNEQETRLEFEPPVLIADRDVQTGPGLYSPKPMFGGE